MTPDRLFARKRGAEPRRVVICPDSFKGSLDAAGVAAAMARGVRDACADTRVCVLPMADGGEGTARITAQALGWEWLETAVAGPDGEVLTAGWGLDRTAGHAVLDVASACALNRIPATRRNPWQLHTSGVGQLIRSALDTGTRHLLIGLGGSGTVDGGAGMLHALGLRFLDRNGRSLPPHPAGLAGLDHIDPNGLDPRLDGTHLIVLGDVDNPLTGPNGAATVFGPQKGLSDDDIPAMDAHLARLARGMDRAGLLRRPADTPGAGAAGGLGFALTCVLGAEPRMGAAYLADLTGLDAAIANADLVLTGEGQLDTQTARGKVIAEVLKRARAHATPVAAIAGRIVDTGGDSTQLGLQAARALCDGSITPQQAMDDPAYWIAVRTRELVDDLVGGHPGVGRDT